MKAKLQQGMLLHIKSFFRKPPHLNFPYEKELPIKFLLQACLGKAALKHIVASHF